MKFVPRPYQEKDINFMIAHPRCINANEPGLGKTIESLMAVRALGAKSILIVGPILSHGVWRSEMLKWLGLPSMTYRGTVRQRAQIWVEFKQSDIKVLICNYQMVKELVAIQPEWDAVIADEIHEGGLLNRNTVKYKDFRKIKSRIMYLLTGTPVRRDPSDLYAPLSLLDPKKFNGYWKFANTWCIVEKGPFGQTIDTVPKEPLKMKKMLSNYLVRNKKKNVLPDLPDKIRQAVTIQMTNTQAKYYRTLEKEMWLEIEEEHADEMVMAPNCMTLTLRLRQLLTTPKLLGSKERGAGIEALVGLVQQEQDAKRPVLILTMFRQALPYIREAIEEITPTIKVFEIHGQITEEAYAVATRFQEHPGYHKVLLATVQCASSWTAHQAKTVIFLGCSWSAAQNTQAEDRAHRIGQTDNVHVYYILYEDTVDDAVLDKLNGKSQAEKWTLHASDMVKRSREKYS